MSHIQPFNTLGSRLIKPGFGDSSTLAGIYAFGLAGDAFDDNVFGMAGGNLRFPGPLQWGLGKDAAVEWFQSRSIDMSKPPAYALISQAANLSGVGGNGHGTFFNLELNDPSWNQAFGTLNAPWIVESLFFSKDTAQGPGHDGTLYGQRTYDPFGGGVFVVGGGSSGSSLRAFTGLYNAHVAAPRTVEQVNGYGQAERLLSTTANGVSGQWITHWNNDVVGPAAGDGPAWIVDIDGRFTRLNTAAAWQPYQRTADPAVGGWGWRAWALDSGGVVRNVLDVTTDGGKLNGVGFSTLAGTMVSYLSDEIDGSVVGVTPFGGNMPVLPGYKLVITSGKVIFTNLHATAFTTNGVMSIGSNATFDDYLQWTNSPNAAQMEAFRVDGGGGPYTSLSGGSAPLFTAGTGKIPDMGTMPSINIKTAPTGTAITSLKLRVLIMATITKLLPDVP